MDWFTLVGTLVAIGVGFAARMVPNFNVKTTPILTAIIAILTQALNVLQGNQGPVGALVDLHTGPVLAAGFFSSEFFKVIANAAIQWFLSTGAHSAPKNMIELAKGK